MKSRHLFISFILGLGLALALLWVLGSSTTSVTAVSVPHARSFILSEASAVEGAIVNAATASGPVTLTHGPIVGAVTSSTAVIWARASQTATVQVEYYYMEDNQAMTVTFPLTATAVYSQDYAAKVELSGLRPSTHYWYDILINGQRKLTSLYEFDTFPEQGEESDFTFVVLNDFQGLRPNSERIDVNNHAFQEADNENPAFVIIGGDFDHSDPTSTDVTATIEAKRGMFRYLYQCEPEKFTGTYTDSSCLLIEHIFSKYPVAHIWDDHDYGVDNGDRTYEYSRTSLMVLEEYFPVYEMSPDGLTAQYGPDGDWQKFKYGHADFFLLDSRSQRDPNYITDVPTKSMLGIRQLNWLTRELSSSEATWKFILTPSVFNPTSGKVDSWAWFESERQHILDFIDTEGITGVVLISGDMHFGGIDDGSNAGLPETIVPAVNFEGLCPTSYPEQFPGIWSRGT